VTTVSIFVSKVGAVYLNIFFATFSFVFVVISASLLISLTGLIIFAIVLVDILFIRSLITKFEVLVLLLNVNLLSKTSRILCLLSSEGFRVNTGCSEQVILSFLIFKKGFLGSLFEFSSSDLTSSINTVEVGFLLFLSLLNNLLDLLIQLGLLLRLGLFLLILGVDAQFKLKLVLDLSSLSGSLRMDCSTLICFFDLILTSEFLSLFIRVRIVACLERN
jgi:hypothetical protein